MSNEVSYNPDISQWNAIKSNNVIPSLKHMEKLLGEKTTEPFDTNDTSLQLVFSSLNKAMDVRQCFETTNPFDANVST